MLKSRSQIKAYVVAMDMGYGHQRAAHPLRFLSPNGKLIYADSYKGIPSQDKEIWDKQRKFYNSISRFKQTPLIGNLVFNIFDHFQEIKPFYPKRDLSAPSLQLRSTYSLIKKKKWGRHLITRLARVPRPLVTTFFVPAYMAEIHSYPGEIYLVVADADVSRAWAPLDPGRSKIKYFVPTQRVYQRLQLYGVSQDKIFLTGFPLPDENVGGMSLRILKADLTKRLINLDPQGRYIPKYKKILEKYLGKDNFASINNSSRKKRRVLTVTFAVGGAGAQRELGIVIAESLRDCLNQGRVKLILVAGIHNEVGRYFRESLLKIKIHCSQRLGVEIIQAVSKDEYFKKFNKILRRTDILWTKPSELSFYAALGLPIIMSEPIGSQEVFNKRWLRSIGAGIAQENPKYTQEWLFDWLNSGWLAEAAMQGFWEAAKYGTYNIEKIIAHNIGEIAEFKTVLQY